MEMAHGIVEVQEGIWIDEQWIQDAGLGRQLRVIIRPGEIRIVPVQPDVEIVGTAKGWDAFRALGNDAQTGRLTNAAAEHDRYLYGKGQKR
jgi:hypothetical protein